MWKSLVKKVEGLGMFLAVKTSLHDPSKYYQRATKALEADKKSVIIPMLIMFISAILFSLMGVLITYGSKLGYTSGEMLMFRGIVQSIITLIVMSINKEFNDNLIPKNENLLPNILWLLFRGVMGAAAGVLYFYSITLVDLGDAITTFSIYPITTSFLAYIILKESIHFTHLIALILAICGVIMIAQPSFIFKNHTSKQYYWYAYLSSIIAAVFAGFAFVAMRKSKHLCANILVLSYSVFSVIEGYLSYLLTETNKLNMNYKIFEWNDCMTLFGIGLIGYIANVSMTYSAQRIEAGIASFIRSSDIIYAYIWGFLIFSERPTATTIIGALIVLFAIMIVSVLKYLTATWR